MAWPTGAPVRLARSRKAWLPASWRTSQPIVRCVCTTPLGSAVVPDVYAISAAPSGSTATGPEIGSAVRRSSKRIWSSPEGSPTTITRSRSESPSRMVASSARKSRWPMRETITSARARLWRRMKPTSLGP